MESTKERTNNMESTKERTKAVATKGGAQMQRTVSRALPEKKPTLKRSNVSPTELARTTVKPKGQVTFVATTFGVNKKTKLAVAKEPESEEDKMEEDSHVEGDVTPRLNESPPCSPKPVDIAPKTSSTPRKVKAEDKEEMATESDDDATPSSPKKVPKDCRALTRTNKFVKEVCKQWMEASAKEGSDISAQKFMQDYFKLTVDINDLFIHMLVSERASLSRILPNDLEEMIPETEDDGPLGLYGNKFIEQCCQVWMKADPEDCSELCANFWMQDYFNMEVENNDIFVHMLMKARQSMPAVVGESSADKDQQKPLPPISPKPPDSPKFSSKFIEESCKQWINACPDDASDESAKEFLRVSLDVKLFKNEDIFIRMLVEERSSLPVFMGCTTAAEAANAVGVMSVEYGPVVKPEGWKVVVEPVQSVPVEMAAAPKSYSYSSRKTGLDSEEDLEDDETLDQKLARELEVRGGDV